MILLGAARRAAFAFAVENACRISLGFYTILQSTDTSVGDISAAKGQLTGHWEKIHITMRCAFFSP